jgi:sec-independent protein translocase protein TatA
MFGLSPIHLLLLAVVVLILFGRGKISEFMGDFGKGIGAFRKGLAEDDTAQLPAARTGADAPPAQADPAPPHAGQR